ncbi:MAG: PQQ-binding-like beta-propeller repeat protein [Candidatus Bathyarchaeota archaeon]|nr:PQQ-binding-like beta-propeller repeat protein [Candidatus Bathyarchaeota archaeon]
MKNKKPNATIILGLFLILTIALPLSTLPTANAHTPSWEIPTYAYITVTPNPVGVDQSMFVIMWLDKVLPNAAVDNDIRFHDYKLTITKPDGSTENKEWPIAYDTTSSQFTLYTPTQVGTYTFKFEYAGQVYTWDGAYQDDTYLPSSAETTLTVQAEPATGAPTYPLPDTFWTRPIEGQNTAWISITSNYLAPNTAGFMALSNRLQPDGLAPGSAHVMWAKPLQDGGLVGGTNTGIYGASYYTGLSYEGRISSPLIMNGKLYYSLPLSDSIVGGMGTSLGGGYVCVDLLTGEEIWKQDYTVYPSFGQVYDYESSNQHGVIPYLWATSGSTWIAYEPSTGSWLFNLTGVPSGSNVYGPSGEILRYVLNNGNNWLACWNNTAAQGLPDSTSGAGMYYWRPVGKVVDASEAYSWNVTIPDLPAGSTIASVIVGDMLLGYTPTSPPGQRWGTTDPYTFWAISLKPETRGELLWQEDYAAPEGNITRLLYAVDKDTRIFYMADKETMQWLAYSMDNGAKLWGPVGDTRDFNYYGTVGMGGTGQAGFAAYGNLYTSGYGGELFCYDSQTGNLVWKYNNTNSGTETPWGLYPLFIGAIADGKVYCYSTEHSPNTPLYKGEKVRCINATSGDEIWTLMSWAGVGSFGSEGFPVADGYMMYLNHYDAQIYTLGKGPSATTIEVSPKAADSGATILIEGTVTDTCAGAKKLVETGEFNIVPAMSDESMGEWMEYLYMQKPCPTEPTGVQVKVTAIDPNGNTQDIGIVTSNANGNFAVAWVPPVPGLYTVTATFEGSNSYYPSIAETAFVVSEAPSASASPTATPPTSATAPPTTAPSTSPSPSVAPPPTSEMPTTTYIAIGIAIAVIVIAAAALVLRKRQ